jgi:restriction endonuclease Mrr
VNQQRTPAGTSEGGIGVLIGLLIVVAGVAATCAFCSWGLALVPGWGIVAVFIVILGIVGVPVFLIWLVVTLGHQTSARDREEAQQRYDAYAAQQEYDAYVAQQQYAAYVAQQQYADQQEAQEEQEADEAFLERISALVSLLSLSPSDFKRVVLLLFESWGYPEIKQLDGAGLAVDFICRDERGEVTAVQCKRYEPDMPVESAEIQRFIDVTVGHYIHHCVFVTTSSFTEPALALGDQHNIQMIDGEELVGLMQEFRAALEE